MEGGSTIRAALVTGGSSGIGLALARVLAEEGYELTLAARRPDALALAAEELAVQGRAAAGRRNATRRAGGFELQSGVPEVNLVAGDLSTEEGVIAVVDSHRERYGRLDVLVNNVGAGLGQPVAEITARRLDLQLALNLRAAILFYRESVDLLRAAGAEHREAWVINTASRAAVAPQPWLSAYSASKAGLLAFSHAMNRELAGEGIRSCALCPGTVRTPLTSYLEREVAGGPPGGGDPAEAGDPSGVGKPRGAGEQPLLEPGDVAGVLRMLLRLSPGCSVGEVILESSSDREWRPPASPAAGGA